MKKLQGLRAIEKEIKDLRGATVSVFGQPQVINAEVDEITIDILDVIDTLKGYEVDTIEVHQVCEHCQGSGEVTEVYDNEDYVEECPECDGMGYIYKEVDALEALEVLYDNGELQEVNCDNSYNWSSPVSNHFDFKVYKNINNDNYYVEFDVHKYGDVRSNYTESAVLSFSYDSEFIETLVECSKYIDVNGYECDINIFSDSIEVSKNGQYITTIHPCDMEELQEELAEIEE